MMRARRIGDRRKLAQPRSVLGPEADRADEFISAGVMGRQIEVEPDPLAVGQRDHRPESVEC